MLYANDEIFTNDYKTVMDRPELKNTKKNKKVKIITNNKFIITASIIFVLFSLMNCVLIYNFVEILKVV